MSDANNIAQLRQALDKYNISGYVQPVHDAFLSEYPPACNRRVEWLTGFSGSAGLAIVLKNAAAFFTDGRYTLQAANEIDGAAFQLLNSTQTPPHTWLGNFARNEKIGFDPFLFSQNALEKFKNAGVELCPVPNLVDLLWKDRPQAPKTPLFIHEENYAGESAQSKKTRMIEAIKQAGADALFISAPESICWLLNIRARDVESTPLALAVMVFFANGEAVLSLDPARVGKDVAAHLGAKIRYVAPEDFAQSLSAVAGVNVLVDSASIPVAYVEALNKAGAKIVQGKDPCELARACKNPLQVVGISAAHQRDGVAVVKLLAWLHEAVEKSKVSECDVVERLLAFRAEHAMFVEPSFATIAGSGANGAIVHYRSTEKTNRALQKGELFLLDSGGQYPDGTTDITRTVAIGTPSAEHKDRFTRVLKGHIALAQARFPEGTTGSQLDALARQYLWQVGLDYDHGTGHGVGQFSGVHEGPQRISKRGGDVALMPGMVISNEPGYYKTGDYGIRIENLVVVERATQGFLQFVTLTCAPIDLALIDITMLSAAEIGWINDYHAWVYRSLAADLPEKARKWLEIATASLGIN